MFTNDRFTEKDNLNQNVLIADDEPIIRAMAARMFQHLGFTVLTADSGVSAVDICEQIRNGAYQQAASLSLAMLDLTMPEMDGAETSRQIKSILPDVPIVLSTGYGLENVMNKYQIDEVDAFLQKPFTLSDVKQVLEAVTIQAPHAVS